LKIFFLGAALRRNDLRVDPGQNVLKTKEARGDTIGHCRGHFRTLMRPNEIIEHRVEHDNVDMVCELLGVGIGQAGRPMHGRLKSVEPDWQGGRPCPA